VNNLDCGRAPRGDGQRFVVRADEKLTAFMELETAIRACSGARRAWCRAAFFDGLRNLVLLVWLKSAIVKSGRSAG
jgi:hypothetical protein